MMLAGQKIFQFYGWGVAALITPTMLSSRVITIKL